MKKEPLVAFFCYLTIVIMCLTQVSSIIFFPVAIFLLFVAQKKS